MIEALFTVLLAYLFIIYVTKWLNLPGYLGGSVGHTNHVIV